MIWYMIYDRIYDTWHYDMIYDMIYVTWCMMIYDMTYDTWYMIWYMIHDIWYMIHDIWKIWYDMIYLLTAVGLTPGGSSTVHIYTQTVHRTTQWNRIYRTQEYINVKIKT